MNSKKQFPILTVLTSGLYPFLHFYNSNLYLASSWQQLAFLVGLCFVFPIVIVLLTPLFFKIKSFQPLEKYKLTVINLVFFIGLLGFLIFHYNKKEMLLALTVSGIIGLLVYKHLKKIILLQFLLAVMSIITLIPKLHFSFYQNNNEWVEKSPAILEANLKTKPNIFVIQPDGYVNIAELNKAPYSYDNSYFENWLNQNDFKSYKNFRSNYYSTLTSNSSLFAMKHHYYSNTNKNTLKTHNANAVIMGKDNAVLKILKNNDYKSYLFTDNSYFLVDREPLFFDFCNVPMKKVLYYDNGRVNGIDIVHDFKLVLDTLQKKNNFVFIEKTIPSHIMYKESLSRGKDQERLNYLKRLDLANNWLKELITEINAFDDNAMIIIVADHGGFVGLDFTLEAVNRRLDSLETISAFSSMLSIKSVSSTHMTLPTKRIVDISVVA